MDPYRGPPVSSSPFETCTLFLSLPTPSLLPTRIRRMQGERELIFGHFLGWEQQGMVSYPPAYPVPDQDPRKRRGGKGGEGGEVIPRSAVNMLAMVAWGQFS